MPDQITNKVIERLEALKNEIISNIESKGITASGRTQRSLKVVPYDGGVMLVSEAGEHAPMETLEIGRPAGNVPGGFRTTKKGVRDVSNTFKGILMQWAKDKGISGFGWGHATMLGRRIAEAGTLRHKKHEDVYSTAVGKAARDLRQMLSVTVKEQIKSNI